VCQEKGLEVDRSVIPKIARGFAGGIGNSGAVCGAVAGGVMAIGLMTGKGESLDESLAELNVAQEFRRRFEAEMTSISCRELTGLDLTKKEGIEKLMTSDVPQRVCFPAVSVAYDIAIDLLKESASPAPDGET